nr:putative ribonuclease H-like domain-containing protein [Tanacetum cinerariifolium]
MPRVDLVPNKQSSVSIRTHPITNSQRHVTIKENVNSNTVTASSIGLVNTARTRRPQPKRNTRNARVPSASKSSEVKKNIIVEEHRRTLLLSKNQKTMSSECNNIKLAIWNDKSKIVCANLQIKRDIGHSFDLKGKLVAYKETNFPNDDKACTSNPQEPMRKLFPNSTVFLGRLSKFVCGYGDLKWGNITITKVYFIEGLGHNLFSVGQFCDADLEVAFRRNTCFIRDMDGKSKRASHPPKPVSNSKQRLHLLHMNLCGPITKDETPDVIKNFLKKIYVRLQAPIIIVRTDNRTEFKNHVLKEYFDSVDITHETSAAKTLQQNGVVERKNRTLVEAARTMLIFSHALLFLWAETIATACYT